MRFLAPPARGKITEAVSRGRLLFESIGCAKCHVPSLKTGANSNPLFDYQEVPLFSDLLLHDIGTGDGIRQAGAEPEEIRTPALWGLRHRRPLLHDGSAANTSDAVMRHGQEAEIARQGFEQLSSGQKSFLLAFLDSL